MAPTIEFLAWRRADPVRAARLFGAAEALWREVGSSPDFYALLTTGHHEHVARTRESLGEDRYEEERRRGAGMPLPRAVDYALGVQEPDEPGAAGEPAEDEPARLTAREWEIAELVAEGLSNRQIATRLVISQRTAEAHVEHILVKLGFTSRSQIAAWVARRATPSTR